jgi:hypothetical protein
VEPSEDEVEPGSFIRRSHHSGRRDGGERSQQVGAHARRRLEGDDPAGAKKVDRKFGSDLAG